MAVSLERIGRELGISKGLVYAYFPDRIALFAALLHREQADLRQRGMASALQAASFRELIGQTTRVYLEHTRDRGALIAALVSEPCVARLMEAEGRREHEKTVRFFVRATRQAFGLPLPEAIAAVNMLMGLTGQAGVLVAQRRLEVEAATAMVVELIQGGLARLAAGPTAPDRLAPASNT